MNSSVQIEEVAYGGWERNLRISNDEIELIVTLEVGPRIIHLAPKGGRNLFCVFPQQLGTSGEPKFVGRGGHRFWVAPESPEDDPFSYIADNAPVEYEKTATGAIFRAPVEVPNKWRKEIEISLDGNKAEVAHRLIGLEGVSAECAPWAVSMMAVGGVAILPQPPLGPHPQYLLPNRALVLWPYTDLKDSRLRLGSRYWTMAQDENQGPVKIGSNHGGGIDGAGTGSWAAYALENVLFVKHFSRDAKALYPDGGSNCELFTNETVLEVETLGPLAHLEAGVTLEHLETWQVLEGFEGFDRESEESLAAALAGVGL